MNQDVSTWEELKKGNQDQFEKLYYEMFDILYNYGLRIINDRSVVEDAIQDVFLNIWKKRKNLNITTSVNNYLFTCLRREILSELKRSKSESLDAQPHLSLRLASPEPNHTNDTQRSIQSEINKLPNRQKEIIYLKYKENMTYEEIEQIMNINRNSSYKLLHKAIHKLKELVRKK